MKPLTALFLAIFCLALLGCESGTETSDNGVFPSDPYAGSAPFSDTPSDIMSVDEVMSKLRPYTNDSKQLANDMVSAVSAVRDDASAERAIDTLKNVRDRMQGMMQELDDLNLVVATSDREKLKEQVDRLAREEQRFGEKAGNDFKSAIEDLANVQLSRHVRMELGNEIQTLAFSAQAMANRMQFMGLIRERATFEPESTLVVAFKNVPFREEGITRELYEELRKASGQPGSFASSGKADGDLYWVRVTPVRDVQRVADRIEVGTVQNVDVSNRRLVIALADADVAKLERRVKQREEERARQEQERIAKQIEKARTKARSIVDEQTGHYERIVNILQGMQSPATAADGAKQLEDAIRDLRFDRDDPLEHVSDLPDEDQQKLTEELNDSVAKFQKRIDQELERINQEPNIRVALATRIGSNLDAKRLLAWDGHTPDNAQPAKDPSNPDYFVANLNDLQNGDHWAREAAMERMAKANPKLVKDPQVRKQIARTIRDIAETEKLDREVAVSALVTWGGKHAMPIIAGMLQERRSGFDRDVMFSALAKYPTKQSAEVVAEYVGNFHDHDDAVRCLRKMGSVAEEALLRIAPSEDPDISMTAIELLGECGTADSYSLLRKAQRSRNPRIVAAARDAIKKVRDRVDAGQAGES